MVSDSGDIRATKFPLLVVFSDMDRKYREVVVERALAHLPRPNDESRKNFDARVRETIRGVRGFQDASKAPGYLLKQPITDEVVQADGLAACVLRIWANSHSSLRALVEEHLGDAGIAAEYPDPSEDCFRGIWSKDLFLRERERFLGVHQDLSADDVALMMWYVSGKVPTEIGESTVRTGILGNALEYLRTLPATAAEWEWDVPDFLAAADRIRQEKDAARSQVAGLDAAFGEIKEDFTALIEFFESDAVSWSAANLAAQADIAEALRLATELQSLLAEYREIHEPGRVVSEEIERARRRSELQPRILDALSVIESRMASETVSGPTPPPAIPEAEEMPKLVGSAGPSPEPMIAAAPNPAEAAAPVEATPPPVDAPVVEPAPPKELSVAGPSVPLREFESLRVDNQGLMHNNQQMEEELRALRSQLYEAKTQEESWRMAYLAYEESHKGIEDDIEGEALGMVDVGTAVALATDRFGGRLRIQLNSESNVENNPFERPDQVWRALQWLATTYHDSRTGEKAVTDFDLSVREACGWWYKPNQGQTTITTYRNSYTTRLNGKTYWLEEHIGKGTNRDARYTIRIAFDWDRELKAVVVGYIGRHQQTDAS